MHPQSTSSPTKSQDIEVDDRGRVYLLAPTGKKRIGRLVGSVFHVRRDPAKHVFRAAAAYGINAQVVNELAFERLVIHQRDSDALTITRKAILEKSFYLEFKSQGFELQRFIRIADFELFDPGNYSLVPHLPEPKSVGCVIA